MRSKIERAVDWALDKIWDAVEPLAGACPVCAFFRGALLGVAVGFGLGVFW